MFTRIDRSSTMGCRFRRVSVSIAAALVYFFIGAAGQQLQEPVVCSNSCQYADDGECDDGSTGGRQYWCACLHADAHRPQSCRVHHASCLTSRARCRFRVTHIPPRSQAASTASVCSPLGSDGDDCAACAPPSTTSCTELGRSVLALPACTSVVDRAAQAAGLPSEDPACTVACAEVWLGTAALCTGKLRMSYGDAASAAVNAACAASPRRRTPAGCLFPRDGVAAAVSPGIGRPAHASAPPKTPCRPRADRAARRPIRTAPQGNLRRS